VSRTTDALLFLLLLVALQTYTELAYGIDQPSSPPLFVWGVGVVGLLVLVASLVDGSQSE
jgi:hypothetical protein